MTAELKGIPKTTSPSTAEPEPKELPNTPEPPKIPLHDCCLCDPMEACKHRVPVHETCEPLAVGKAGIEDYYNKVNELCEFLKANGMKLTKK